MNRYREMLAVTALVVIAAAFAAQPTSVHDGHSQGAPALQRELWVPGANALMSAHEATALLLVPPR
jgi:hypothetical protein